MGISGIGGSGTPRPFHALTLSAPGPSGQSLPGLQATTCVVGPATRRHPQDHGVLEPPRPPPLGDPRTRATQLTVPAGSLGEPGALLRFAHVLTRSGRHDVAEELGAQAAQTPATSNSPAISP